MPTRRFSLSNLSIKHRLPLLIGLLLLGIIFASSWTSYLGVRESALEAGQQRLPGLTLQLTSLSQQSTALLLSRTVTAANDPAIRAFLQSPLPASRTAALSILQQFSVTQDPNNPQVEGWSPKPLLLSLTNSDDPAPQGDLDGELALCAGKGIGLGLPICRRTIEEHRGTIAVESEVAKGTTVRIVIPSTETGVNTESE
jgi:hypothetical protein